MVINYISLNSLAKELYDEEDQPSSSTLTNYKRSKRDQFRRIVDLLGLNMDDYIIEGEYKTQKRD